MWYLTSVPMSNLIRNSVTTWFFTRITHTRRMHTHKQIRHAHTLAIAHTTSNPITTAICTRYRTHNQQPITTAICTRQPCRGRVVRSTEIVFIGVLGMSERGVRSGLVSALCDGVEGGVDAKAFMTSPPVYCAHEHALDKSKQSEWTKFGFIVMVLLEFWSTKSCLIKHKVIIKT